MNKNRNAAAAESGVSVESMGEESGLQLAAETTADDRDTTQHSTLPAAAAVTTPRNPERCIVYYPATKRFTRDRGMVEEEQGKLGGVDVPADAENVEAAIAAVIALRLAEDARQHDIEVIRVQQVGNGPAIAAALREAGLWVVEFPG